MKMQIAFPGRLSASAGFHGQAEPFRQTPSSDATAGNKGPLDLFLASLGTCAALYAFRFCQRRDLDTEGMRLLLSTERGSETSRLASIKIEIHLPQSFPEKYRAAITRAAEQCKVMRHALSPPRCEIHALRDC